MSTHSLSAQRIWSLWLLTYTSAPICWPLMTTRFLRVDQASTHSSELVKCALFLSDACSSFQQTPKVRNLRKILRVIQQGNDSRDGDRFSLRDLSSGFIGCPLHTRHCANPLVLSTPSNREALKRFHLGSCEEPSFAPISWLKAALTLPQECHLSRDLHMLVFCALLQRGLGKKPDSAFNCALCLVLCALIEYHRSFLHSRSTTVFCFYEEVVLKEA